MSHHCHANGCDVTTPPRLFMCFAHWKMVPPSMQAAVWASYRNAPAAERARDPDYLGACANACEHVARAEGKPETNSYRRILKLIEEAAR